MVTFQDIAAARDRLAGLIIRTPVVYSQTLSRLAGAEVFLKLENLQTTGSFKLRGSLNKIQLLQSRGGLTGVVAASAGNHAQGVAYAAARVGLPATIVMPQWASISKQLATAGYGGRVEVGGADLAQALARAQELAATGLTLIHPYDDPEVIAGQGTIGLEILADLPETDTVIVPVGGGGLAAGVALALKEGRPGIRVIGVQAERVPAARQALAQGQPVSVPAAATLADGINVRRVGEHPFPLLQRYLDGVELVSEGAIAAAVLLLLDKKKVLAEGAGATPAAALLGPLAGQALGRRLVLVISGGNIDIPVLGRVLQRGLLNARRLLTLRVVLADTPGSLGRLTTLLGELGANILHLYHDRRSRTLPLEDTRVEVDLETKGEEHGRQIMDTLARRGYAVTEKT